MLSYFAGNNDEQRNILSARTVPFLITPPGRSPVWTAYLEVSPTQFPDSFLVRTPYRRARRTRRNCDPLRPQSPTR